MWKVVKMLSLKSDTTEEILEFSKGKRKKSVQPLTIGEDLTHLKVRRCESNDWGLV